MTKTRSNNSKKWTKKRKTMRKNRKNRRKTMRKMIRGGGGKAFLDYLDYIKRNKSQALTFNENLKIDDANIRILGTHYLKYLRNIGRPNPRLDPFEAGKRAIFVLFQEGLETLDLYHYDLRNLSGSPFTQYLLRNGINNRSFLQRAREIDLTSRTPFYGNSQNSDSLTDFNPLQNTPQIDTSVIEEKIPRTSKEAIAILHHIFQRYPEQGENTTGSMSGKAGRNANIAKKIAELQREILELEHKEALEALESQKILESPNKRRKNSSE